MAVRSYEEIMEMIRTRIGEDSSDEAIALIEDISDTLQCGDSEKVKQLTEEKEELDRTWRERYKARFFGGSDTDPVENLQKTVIETEPESEVVKIFESED